MSDTTTSQEDNNWRVLPNPAGGGGAAAADYTGTDTTQTTNQQRDDVDLLSARAAWDTEAYRDSLALYDRLQQCTDSYVVGPIQSALTCLDHALRLYGPASVLCSFNGGKDAVVILHLMRAAVAAHYSKQQQAEQLLEGDDDSNNSSNISSISRPRVVYFDHADEFPEILTFLHDTVATHDLDMIAFEQGTKFQDGLRVLIDKNVAAAGSTSTDAVLLPMAFVLGTRLTDPNAVGQQQFAPSSHYMPPFMRVNPVLDWTYGHVWHFLRLFQLSYCPLYDQGYTSLGTVQDTLPCPALAVVGQNQTTTTTAAAASSSSSMASTPKYWPAYMLRDWDQERAGRICKTKKTKSTKPPPRKVKSTAAMPSDDSAMRSTLHSTVSSSMGHLSTMSDGRVLPDDIPAVGESGASLGLTLSGSEDEDEDDVRSYVSYNSDKETQTTAGILIIGDEILKGFTADTNTQVAATALRDQNVVLKCVVVVSDDMDDIVQEIQRLQTMVDVVITSGGVGATHDDITMKSVAAALNCDMELHEEMAQLLRDKMNQKDEGESPAELTDAQVKMATLPTCSKLRYMSKNSDDWPVLQCKNIFILPGIPEFFAKKILNVAEYLSCQLERSPAYKVVLQVDENSIVPVLNQVVANHPNVSIGSYPFVSHPEYKTVITVEGRLMPLVAMGWRRNSTIFDRDMIGLRPKTEDSDVQMALDELINRLPEGSVLRVDVDDMRFS